MLTARLQVNEKSLKHKDTCVNKANAATLYFSATTVGGDVSTFSGAQRLLCGSLDWIGMCSASQMALCPLKLVWKMA